MSWEQDTRARMKESQRGEVCTLLNPPPPMATKGLMSSSGKPCRNATGEPRCRRKKGKVGTQGSRT